MLNGGIRRLVSIFRRLVCIGLASGLRSWNGNSDVLNCGIHFPFRRLVCRLSPFFFKKTHPIDQSEIIEITCLVLHHVSVERVEQPISARRSGKQVKKKWRERGDIPGQRKNALGRSRQEIWPVDYGGCWCRLRRCSLVKRRPSVGRRRLRFRRKTNKSRMPFCWWTLGA